jgi:hypothetical protein
MQDSPQVNGVKLFSTPRAESPWTGADDFKKSGDELLSLSGLSHNFRRSAKRKPRARFFFF